MRLLSFLGAVGLITIGAVVLVLLGWVAIKNAVPIALLTVTVLIGKAIITRMHKRVRKGQGIED